MLTYLFLIYKLPRFFLPSFESIGFSVYEKKRKTEFFGGYHGGHLGFPIGKVLATFDLLVAPILQTKFSVSWPFGSGKEVQNRFLRC